MLSDGRVLVTGGRDAGGSNLAATEAYDPASNTWTTLVPLAVPRSAHTATLLDDGRVMVAFGEGGGFSTEILLPAPASSGGAGGGGGSLGGAPGSTTVTLNMPPVLTEGSTTTVSILDPGIASCTWTITGGTILGFPDPSSVQFKVGPAGQVLTLSVAVTFQDLTQGTGSASALIQGAGPSPI
jgi:hypothetical protein